MAFGGVPWFHARKGNYWASVEICTKLRAILEVKIMMSMSLFAEFDHNNQ